jgi:parallel beta-helix repeat protein
MKFWNFLIVMTFVIGLYAQFYTQSYLIDIQNSCQENRNFESTDIMSDGTKIDSYKMFKRTDGKNEGYFANELSSGLFSNFVSHYPISIIGNEDFIAQALTENWNGDGTESNPYVIDGMNITDSGVMISIRNTDLYFQIDNCILFGGEETAISFSNVSNGFITNNTIYNNEKAIRLETSNNNSIINNNVNNNNKGIFLGSDSEDNSISNNIVYNNEDGIIVEGDKNTISSNSVYDNKDTGINLFSSNYHTISSNDIVSNDMYGINCNNSNYNSIYSNDFSNNGNTGLYLIDSSNNAIRWNNFGRDQAIDDGSQNTFNFNYWSDVSGHADQDGDGIVDWTMDILGSASSRDRNPLRTKHRLTFVLTYPNGGETLGKTTTIEWKTPLDTYSHTLTYSLYYRSANVKRWTLLVSGLTTNMYEWDTTTISSSSNCRIKVVVSCSENLVAEDTSDAMFTVKNELTKPVVIFPNGGEILENNSDTISWLESIDSSGHAVTYSVSYSKDNGTTWNSLDSGLVTTSYEWDTSSLADGTKYLIHVVATCSEGLTVEDTSDQTFSIKKGVALAPFFEFILIALPTGYFLKRIRNKKKKSSE